MQKITKGINRVVRPNKHAPVSPIPTDPLASSREAATQYHQLLACLYSEVLTFQNIVRQSIDLPTDMNVDLRLFSDPNALVSKEFICGLSVSRSVFKRIEHEFSSTPGKLQALIEDIDRSKGLIDTMLTNFNKRDKMFHKMVSMRTKLLKLKSSISTTHDPKEKDKVLKEISKLEAKVEENGKIFKQFNASFQVSMTEGLSLCGSIACETLAVFLEMQRNYYLRASNESLNTRETELKLKAAAVPIVRSSSIVQGSIEKILVDANGDRSSMRSDADQVLKQMKYSFDGSLSEVGNSTVLVQQQSPQSTRAVPTIVEATQAVDELNSKEFSSFDKIDEGNHGIVIMETNEFHNMQPPTEGGSTANSTTEDTRPKLSRLIQSDSDAPSHHQKHHHQKSRLRKFVREYDLEDPKIREKLRELAGVSMERVQGSRESSFESEDLLVTTLREVNVLAYSQLQEENNNQHQQHPTSNLENPAHHLVTKNTLDLQGKASPRRVSVMVPSVPIGNIPADPNPSGNLGSARSSRSIRSGEFIPAVPVCDPLDDALQASPQLSARLIAVAQQQRRQQPPPLPHTNQQPSSNQ